MTALPAPCWVLKHPDGSYDMDEFTEAVYHYPSAAEARQYAHDTSLSAARLDTVCVTSPVCTACGWKFDEDPGAHYPGGDAALAAAEGGGWHRIGDRVWCWECLETAPEVVEEKARQEREAMHTPLIPREEITP